MRFQVPVASMRAVPPHFIHPSTYPSILPTPPPVPLLQGPDTDPEAIAVIRKGIAEGRDTAITLVNYKKDGSQFWNRFFVAPLRGVDGAIVNFVGVQCEVKDAVAQALVEQQQTLYPRLLGSQQVMPPLPPLPAPLAPAASAVAAAAPGPVQAAPVGAAGRTRRRG